MAKRPQNPPNPDLLARLWRDTVLSLRLMMDGRVSGSAKLIPVLAVLYILFPVDFLPEMVLGPFGIVDDLGAFLLGLQLFIRSAPRAVVDEYRGGSTASEDETPPAELHDPRSFVIEGTYEQRERPAPLERPASDQAEPPNAGKFYRNKD